MIKCQGTKTGKAGLSIDTESHFEGRTYGFVDLRDTCVLDFHFHGDRLLLVLQEGGPAIYAIIHSVMALSKEIFNLSVVRKGTLEMACNGRRKFCLVDAEAISDVTFGVFIIGGPVGKVLFLECRQTYFFGTQILKHIQLVDFIIHLYWVYGRACRILETPSAHHGG